MQNSASLAQLGGPCDVQVYASLSEEEESLLEKEELLLEKEEACKLSAQSKVAVGAKNTEAS